MNIRVSGSMAYIQSKDGKWHEMWLYHLNYYLLKAGKGIITGKDDLFTEITNYLKKGV